MHKLETIPDIISELDKSYFLKQKFNKSGTTYTFALGNNLMYTIFCILKFIYFV